MPDTAQIRTRLLARRAELLGRSEAVAADLRHERDPLVADFADQATQRENEEVLHGIDESTRHSLQQVNVALARVERDPEEPRLGLPRHLRVEAEDVGPALRPHL